MLNKMISPQSIAVVGASPKPGIGLALLENLRRAKYEGRVLPVNPGYERVAELDCYPSLTAIGEPVDLVLVAVPAKSAPAVLGECQELRIPAAVVVSSGFAETGGSGIALQSELVRAAGDTTLLGPNCQGFVWSATNTVATFTPAVSHAPLKRSGVAYVGQSGAVGGAFMALAGQQNFGLAAWFSTGNQAGLSVTDVATDLVERPEVEVLALYVEAVPDGASWMSLLTRAEALGKHIVMLRSGTSTSGQLAASSHTGSLVGLNPAFDLLSRELGVIRVHDLNEMVDAAFTTRPKLGLGSRAGVISSSGGLASLAADQLEEHGFTLPRLSEATREILDHHIPTFGTSTNPVDVTAHVFAPSRLHEFGAACRIVLEDESVDFALVIITNAIGEDGEKIARQIADLARQTTKPLAVVWLADFVKSQAARRVLSDNGLGWHGSIAGCVKVLSSLRSASQARRGMPSDRYMPALPPLPYPAAGPGVDEHLLFAEIGLDAPASRVAKSSDEAAQFARELGGTQVFKIVSRDILHKSDVGGVIVGATAESAASTFEAMMRRVTERSPDSVVEGILVQEQVSGGVELIVGAIGASNGYPAVITVGFGGTATELDNDVVSSTAPISPREARSMLQSLRKWPLLDGYRNSPALAVDQAARTIALFSQLAATWGDSFLEMEINPLIVTATQAKAADFLLTPRSAS